MAEPKPINHDAVSTGLEVGSKALGYGVVGFLGAAVVGGALAAGALALVGISLGGTLGIIGIGAAAIAAGAAWGPVAGLGGALFGSLKGASNVNQEVASYRQHSEALAESRKHTIDSRANDAGIASMQQGYLMGHNEGRQAGIQEGAAMVIQQLQAQEQQMAEQAKMQGGFAAKEDKKRAEQAANPSPQIG